MSAEPPAASEARINLRSIKALCVDSNQLGLEILGQMLMGFGVERIVRAQSGEEARRIVKAEAIDLILCDASLADETGYELIRWLRRSDIEPNRFAPIIVVSGHTREREVNNARDAGANFVVAKPTSPAVLMQRIYWVAQGGRSFVEAPNFTGPDRRFKFDGPPNGGGGRRKCDLSGELGDAKDPNLSQDEIDSVIKPQKVSL
ncbi:response regulator [Brevundimonas sp.]|uniref:response regulator n=1 Tax=Brevundimonas sp. TaxID=1871086 RepID=UPI00286AF394|nr:response regulator [Brevundimonas sp.]